MTGPLCQLCEGQPVIGARYECEDCAALTAEERAVVAAAAAAVLRRRIKAESERMAKREEYRTADRIAALKEAGQ